MATERVTERTDGLTSERVVERGRDGGVTYVERGGSGMGAVIAGIGILALVAIIAFFLLQANRNDAMQTQAVTSAASSIAESAEGAAQGVAGAADRAADTVAPN